MVNQTTEEKESSTTHTHGQFIYLNDNCPVCKVIEEIDKEQKGKI